jgi:hypothetical protein
MINPITVIPRFNIPLRLERGLVMARLQHRPIPLLSCLMAFSSWLQQMISEQRVLLPVSVVCNP